MLDFITPYKKVVKDMLNGTGILGKWAYPTPQKASTQSIRFPKKRSKGCLSTSSYYFCTLALNSP